MKKLIALFLTLMISTGAFASGLDEALTDLNYELTVEWDQQDEALYLNKINAFSAKVAAASKEEKEELFNILIAGNPEVEKLALEMSSMNLTHDEMIELSLKMSRESQMQGASWNGRAVVAGVAVVAVAVLAYYYYAASQIEY